MELITEKNYFSCNNKALTNSKIGDFLKDVNYFYRKNLLGSYTKDKTDSLIIGSAVDCWITKGKEAFDKLYYVVSRRSKEAADYELQLNNTMYEEVSRMCQNITRQKAYEQLKDYKSQAIIQIPMDLGEHFDKLAGKPDWYRIKKDSNGKTICTIVDLKTTADASERKYYYSCEEYGYFRQQAVYRYILSVLLPEIDSFFHFHLVLEKDSDDIYNCYTRQLEEETIQDELNKLPAIFEKIKNEKEFSPKNVGFEDATVIGRHINDR